MVLTDDLERGIHWFLMLGAVPGNYIRDVVKATNNCKKNSLLKLVILMARDSLVKSLWIFRMNRWKSMWDISRQGVLRNQQLHQRWNPCDIFWQIQAWLQFVWPGTEMVTRWSNDFDDWNSEVSQFCFLNVSGGFAPFFTNLCMPFFWCFLNSMQSSFLLRWPRKAESEFQNHLQCQGHWGLIFQAKPMAALLPCFKQLKQL